MTDRYEPQAAFVEDYDSDGNEPLPETRQYAHQKRKPDAVVQVNGDGHSDSGYSSHTAATVNSADSSGAPYRNQDKRFVLVQPNPPLNPPKPRPAVSTRAETGRPENTSQSPRKGISRSSSTRSPRKSHTKAPEGCNCQECVPQSYSPLDAPWDLDYAPFNESGARPSGPPSPQYHRNFQSAGCAYEGPPAFPSARPRTASMSRRQRPVSFAGMPYESFQYSGSPLGAFPEMGPPPSRSAYVNGTPYPPTSFPPPGFIPTPVRTTPSPALDYGLPYGFDVPNPRSRPQPQPWQTQSYSGAPSPGYGKAIINYDYADPGQMAPSMSRRNSTRESGIDPYYSERARREIDAERMPPPRLIPDPRPRIHHAATTSDARNILRPGSVQPREHGATIIPERSRSQSQSRPSANRKSMSYTVGQPRTPAEAARQHRASYYESDQPQAFDRERERERQKKVERYQEEVSRAAKAIPLTTEALKSARKSGRLSSDSGSHSKGSRDGGETKKGEREGFTLRLNSNANVNLDFKGEPKGQTISLRPRGDGDVELSIGGPSRHTDPVGGASSGYASNGRRSRKEIEDARRSREDRASSRGRLSKKGSYDPDLDLGVPF
jgi:hypothetical protein